MNIRWDRIVGVILLVASAILTWKLAPFLGHLIEVTNQDWGYESPIKAIMLGVLCLTSLCGIRLLMRR